MPTPTPSLAARTPGWTVRRWCRRVMYRPLWLCLLLLYGALAYGQTAAIEPGGHWPLQVWRDTGLLRDDSGSMDLQQVAALPAGAQRGFRRIGTEKLKSLDMKTAWWLQLKLANHDTRALKLRLALSPYDFREIDIYLQKPGSAWQHLHGGLTSPLAHRSSRSRLPTAAFALEPGESIRILARIVTTQPHLIKPVLYTNDGFIAHEVHMRGWDSLLFGGLLALGWIALMIALFSRNGAFLLLSAEALLVAGYEAVRRGYGHLYLWPDSTEWSYRSLHVLGHLSLAVFLLFIFEVARQEKVRLPGRRWLTGFTAFELGMALASWLGDTFLVRRIAAFSTPLFAVGLLLLVAALARQRVPTRRLMLLITAYVALHMTLSALEPWGLLPDFVYQGTLGGLGVNPLAVLFGFYLSLALLAAWITLLGKQRNSATEALAQWQAQENQRLSAEVATQTQALNKALEYANDKNRQKTEILSYIGHDLRAPLATIVGYARLLVHSPASERAAQLRAIERNVDYQLDLIDELLNYARAELKPLHLVSAPVEMAGLLEDVVRQGHALSQGQHNRFQADLPGILPHTVLLDARRLRQVLLNLLSNAAKFTRRGLITLRVRAVRADTASPVWTLDFEVSDTGIGIDPGRQDSIFKAFEQGPTRPEGVGLGLFIARSIIRTMGGELYVQSAPDQGSTFRFELKLMAADDHILHWAPPDLSTQALAQTVPALPSEAPPPHDRLELAVLARDGQLSDIEYWLARMSFAYPHCTEFFTEIRGALQALDLERIESLALAQPAPADAARTSTAAAATAEAPASKAADGGASFAGTPAANASAADASAAKPSAAAASTAGTQ
ncbi:sensor histidine kinase [Candidimonas nitroreducens]